MTVPIEDYAMIGDGETVALVSRNGSIDWLCLPRFDSPACCAALLGDAGNGHWSIAPEAPVEWAQHRYQRNTLVIETDLVSAAGTIRVTDFMPMRSGTPVLVRIVTGLAGSVPTRMEAKLRFDDGHMPPWVTATDSGAVMHVGPDKVLLYGPGGFIISDHAVTSRVVVETGSQHVFVLCYGASHDAEPDRVDALAALNRTQTYWRDWIGRFDAPPEHGDAVCRSLLTLKALIHRPTGGVIAAPTTSLPEEPGGQLNWDYRFCWLRDASFALNALVGCGYLQEAQAWRDWILRAVAGAPDMMQIVYRVDGSRRLDEAELPWLAGYRYARPVRIGNAAAGQFQLDVWGELPRTLHDAERAGLERNAQGRHLEHAIVRHVERIWSEPDQGLWESRGEPRHYTHSKVMCWVVLHRFLKGSGAGEVSAQEFERLKSLRDRIHATVCNEGFDQGLNSFTSYFGGQAVDASLLLLSAVDFLPADEPRMAGTIALIERRLVHDGLVKRHESVERPNENAFLACSFWLAECFAAQGRHDEARSAVERALAVRSPLGLFSEQYNTRSRRLAGNFPQTLSHLAHIHSALAMRRLGSHAP